MKKRILNYRKKIDELLYENAGETDWESLKREHLAQLSFFQHERLIHLIVTVAFALLEVIAVVGAVASGQLSLLALAVILLVLLIPYISHYYLLENEVQRMYGQYDQIVERVAKPVK